MSTKTSMQKLFSMAMHQYGYEFAKWFTNEVYLRRQAAFYPIDQAISDWEAQGRPTLPDEVAP